MSEQARDVSALLGKSVDPVEAGVTLRTLAEDSATDAAILIAETAASSGQLADSDPAVVGGLLRLIHVSVLKLAAETRGKIDIDALTTIVTSLSDETPNRFLLLHLLTMIRSPAALDRFVRLVGTFPPRDWQEAGHVLSPLMQHDDWPVDRIFPEIFVALERPALAAPILDLASFVTRQGRIDPHPASDHTEMLIALLGQVSARLGEFEENPRAFGNEITEVQTRLGEAVALAVSLCDSLALIGDTDCIGKLNQALQLSHRRVQCEAAGALAKFGDQRGKQRLIELTEDAASRLRAIQYADELGIGDQVDERFRGDSATAEANLSLWLTQPQQMGVPPTEIEVIDTRRMIWPSFTDPQDVYLIRFQYDGGHFQYSNVGIAGPVTFALGADVADLPAEDIYAMYAGWHAEHPEIFTVERSQFNDAQRRVAEVIAAALQREGFESLEPKLLGVFLDEHAAVFSGVKDETACLVASDGLEVILHPTAGRPRPLKPEDIFNLFKGRRMLRTFNPSGIATSPEEESPEV